MFGLLEKMMRVMSHCRGSSFSLALFFLSPFLFPMILAPYAFTLLTWVRGDPIWMLALGVFVILACHAYIEVTIRRILNRNLKRLDSAIRARQQAAHSNRPIALILRSFNESRSYSDEGAGFSIFEELEPAIRSAGFLPVALGANLPVRPDHEVAFLETTEATWWDAFCIASKAAGIVIIAPDDTSSLQQEIAWLAASNRISSVVFLMMPRPRQVLSVSTDMPLRLEAGPGADRKEAWDGLKRSLSAAVNITLPSYDPKGALVWTDGRDRMRVTPLRMDEDDDRVPADYRRDYGVDFQKAMLSATSELPLSSSSAREVWPSLLPFAISRHSWSIFRPPGSTGLEWRELSMYCALNWGVFLGFAISFGAFLAFG